MFSQALRFWRLWTMIITVTLVASLSGCDASARDPLPSAGPASTTTGGRAETPTGANPAWEASLRRTLPADLPGAGSGTACAFRLPSGWLAAENRRIGRPLPAAGTTFGAPTVSAYATSASAGCGDVVHLAVSAPNGRYVVRVWRVGDYRGVGARVTWTSPAFTATPQGTSGRDLVGAGPGWATTTTVQITSDWLPGLYILQVVGTSGTQASGGWTPVVVGAGRTDPAARPAAVYVAPTMSWAAYNPYGGASLYRAFTGDHATEFQRRARVVAMGRPSVLNGQRQIAEYTVPLVQAIEAAGTDLDYVADTDVDATPSLLTGRSLVVIGSHAEYATTRLYDALEAARNQGTNLAFLGGNQIYWHVRLGRAADGTPTDVTCYRILSEDPQARDHPQDATVRWRDRPLSRPDAVLLGAQYDGLGIVAPLQALNPPTWTGWSHGQLLPAAASGEVDAIDPSSPPTTQVLAQGTAKVGATWVDATSTYYVAPSGAAVIDTGSLYTGCLTRDRCGGLRAPSTTRRALNTLIRAVITGFSSPTFGAAHPPSPAQAGWSLGAAFAHQHPHAVGRSLRGGDD